MLIFKRTLIFVALAIPISSYGGVFHESSSYSGSKGELTWSAAEDRYIDGSGIHSVKTFTSYIGNHTPYDAYARNELDVTGSGGCAEDEIIGITGCNRSGEGSYIEGVGYALYDDKYYAGYEAEASYFYQFTVTPALGADLPSDFDGYIPLSFSYEITASVTADSLSVAPTFNGNTNLFASASVELFEFTNPTAIISEEVTASLFMENEGSNIFDNDVKYEAYELSLLSGTTYSLVLESYIEAGLWVLEYGDQMNITADAYADPILDIDPTWEFADYFDITYGMADMVFVHESVIGDETASVAVPEPSVLALFFIGVMILVTTTRLLNSR